MCVLSSAVGQLDIIRTSDTMSDTSRHVAHQRRILAEIRKHRRPRRKQFMHSRDVQAIVARNLQFGVERKSVYRSSWDVSGNCSRAKPVELSGRKFIDVIDQAHSAGLDLEVRCRKCTECLRARSHLWRLRATEEATHSARTWFGTLTLSPESHALSLARCRQKEALNGIDFDCLSEGEQFAVLVHDSGREITKYLKRIRKQSSATLRYLLVVEKHASGLPHFHMLVHEPFIGQSIGERQLRKQWQLGFSKWNLVKGCGEAVTPKAIFYACKYIAKSAETRVRASLHYGTTPCGVALS